MCLPVTVVTAPGVPVDVRTNCVDAGLNPTVTVVTPPASGTLTGLPGQYVPSAGFRGTDHLTYTVTLTYTPDPGYVGTDVITFVGIDGAFVTASYRIGCLSCGRAA